MLVISTLTGSDADDILSGSSPTGTAIDREVIYGLDGDDILSSGPLAANLYGGPGDDTLMGSNPGDVLIGGPGRDLMVGDAEAASSQRFVLDGDGDRDIIQDFVILQDSIDLSAWGVSEWYELRIDWARNDTLLVRYEEHSVAVSKTNYTPLGPPELVIEDVFIFAPPNQIAGTAESEKLVGTRSGDTLTDGAGRDVLIGGWGRDTFVLSADGEIDHIKDFAYNFDTIDIRAWNVSDRSALSFDTHRSGAVTISYEDELLFVRGLDNVPIEDGLAPPSLIVFDEDIGPSWYEILYD